MPDRVANGPRVAAHVGVIDEVELIGPCLDHLRSIGVGDIVVHDMGSSDGTREVLRAREGPDLRVIESSNAEPADQWHQSIAEAVRALDADWVVTIDADEFILPREGNLPAALARADGDVIRLPRYNMVLGPDGLRLPMPLGPDRYGKVDLFARAEPDFRDRLRQDPTLFWLRAVPLHKTAVRPAGVGRFTDGMHAVIPQPGAKLREGVAGDVLIAHAALTTYPRFARKIANIREVFRLHEGALSPGFGWHWRRWVALDDAGALRGEFERSHLSWDALAQLRADGVVQSAADLLSAGGR